MKCKLCDESVFYNELCREHFIEYFENKVNDTISKYGLLSTDDKIVIAASGGKDSLVVMHIVKKLFGNVDAIVIDEGIEGSRDVAIGHLKKFCKDNNIKLKIISFEKEFGKDMDKIMYVKQKFNSCHICGTLRRSLLNKYSKGYDKIVTGHNLDDECQAILVNLFRGNPSLLPRLGPMTGLKKFAKFFTQRVKPLYFLKEEEILLYAKLKNFAFDESKCKYAGKSYRWTVKQLLNDYEKEHKGTKQNIIDNFLKVLPKLKQQFHTDEEPNQCKKCGQPAKGEICKCCEILEEVV